MPTQLGPAARLKAVDGAPALARGASVSERYWGPVSAGGVCALLALAAHRGLPTWGGVAVLAVALAIIVGWRGFHTDRARRRPHTWVETAAGVAAACGLGLPGSQILWNAPLDWPAALAAALLPSVALLAFLVLRWRR
ncbi:hypothetical protein [Streptomyces sp. NPDC045470]|uniref:hypothetical protein n=1 Tax=Streptomyces sp. NPDC045470 TaxID=3155469 RepID=UPI0033EE7E30